MLINTCVYICSIYIYLMQLNHQESYLIKFSLENQISAEIQFYVKPPHSLTKAFSTRLTCMFITVMAVMTSVITACQR